MTIGFIFWLLMILWIVLGVYWRRGEAPATWGGDLLFFLLFFLLGWKVFGWPIAG